MEREWQARIVVAKECGRQIEGEKAKQDQKSEWQEVKKEINGITDVGHGTHGISWFLLEGWFLQQELRTYS